MNQLLDLLPRERLENRLADRAGPVLSDGTRLRDLVDFDRHEVSMRLLNDQEIHRLELKRIFARAWIVVGHETEIPNPGDYILRYIGEDQVIVTRSRSGKVHIFLNACPHRGMEICRSDRGNSSTFKCPYHGWTFNCDGRLMGAPFEKQMYGDWDKSLYGLYPANVAIRHGMVFGSFDREPPSLDDWLGEFGWYFDVMYGVVEMEAVAGSSPRMTIPANWKTAAEQSSGDGYHTVTLHRSLVDLGMTQPTDHVGYGLDAHDVSSIEGHGLRIVETAHGVAKQAPQPEDFPIGWFVAGAMFPGIHVGGSANRGGADAGMLQVDMNLPIHRVANVGAMCPRGPAAYEVWQINLVEKGAPEYVREALHKQTAFAAIVADDYEAWISIQRSARGAVAQDRAKIRYNTLKGSISDPSWPGPGLNHHGFPQDDNQWHFWLRWYDMMTAPEAEAQ